MNQRHARGRGNTREVKAKFGGSEVAASERARRIHVAHVGGAQVVVWDAQCRMPRFRQALGIRQRMELWWFSHIREALVLSANHGSATTRSKRRHCEVVSSVRNRQ